MKAPRWLKPILPPDFTRHENYLKSCAEATPDFDDATDYTLALDEAKAQFDAYESILAALDEKAERMLRTCAAAVGLEVTMIAAFKIVPGAWLIASLASLVGAIMLLVIAQIPVLAPSRPDPKSIVEGLPKQKNPMAWIACALRREFAGFRIAIKWKGDIIEKSIFLLGLGIALLVPALISFRYVGS